MQTRYPRNIRLGREMYTALEEIGVASRPPVPLNQRGAFAELLRRTAFWARDILLRRIHICPDDLTPMVESADGFTCPQCGGTWRRPAK